MIKIIQIAQKWQLGLFISVAACLLVSAAQAEPLTAKITKVDGSTIHVRLDGKNRPSIGNKATISFEVAGVGQVPLKGSWRVKKVSGSSAILEPEGRVDQPRVGQTATIEAIAQTAVRERKPRKAGKTGKSLTFFDEKPERKSKKPVKISEASRENIRFIQRRLRELGYTPGTADGLPGARTRDAIRAFQRDNNLTVDGRASPAVLSAIRTTRKVRETVSTDRRSNKGLQRDAYNYEFGKGGKTKDVARSFELYQILAKRGYPPGLFGLGVAHAFGKGVEKDFVRARQYFEQAAAGGHGRALYNLAVIHRKGLGVTKNSTKAMDYMHRAAATGLVNAYHGLGTYYENGLTGQKDKDAAISWYRQAAVKGHKDAQTKLKQMGLGW